MTKHTAYYKNVSHLKEVDVYRILDLYQVKSPAIQHAIKKLLVSGNRGGGKSVEQDYKEAFESIKRALDMIEEDTMDTPCRVTSDLKQYTLWQPSAEEVDALEQRVTEQANYSMLCGEPYYPFSAENLADAWEEIDLAPIAVALQSYDYAAVGKTLSTLVYDYYKRKATRAAEISEGL